MHGSRFTKKGDISNGYIKKHYGNSKQIRYCNEHPIVPIGYIQCKNPMNKRANINRYTAEGRKAIHKELEVNTEIMRKLMNSYSENRSIEYIDNRISLYAAQHGKCRITGRILEFDEIHCHHIKPLRDGGGDNYQNLIIIHRDVHKLLHSVNHDKITKYIELLLLDTNMLKKLNKYRKKAKLELINPDEFSIGNKVTK